MPWTQLIVSDMHVLRQYLPNIFANMSVGDNFLNEVFELTEKSPAEWKLIVNKYFTPP